MNHFSKKEGDKKNSIILMLFAFSFLFSVAVLGQTAIERNTVYTMIENKAPLNNKVENTKVKQEVSSNVSNINFILWFMGSKESTHTTIFPMGLTGKRQLRTSGTTLNKLLIKAFLKKAANFDSIVV